MMKKIKILKNIDFTNEIPKCDVQKSRITAMLGYLCFFIPLVFHDDKQFARFHCNQSLINFLLATVFTVMLSLIPGIGLLLVILQQIVCIIIVIRGMILAGKGKAVGIPVVGKITLIAYKA